MGEQLAEVSFACNDVRTGSFVGHAEAIELDTWPDGHHVGLIGPRLRVAIGGNRRVKVGRRLFDGDSRTRWRGNWCWDSVHMPLPEAKRLLAYLRERGWSIQEATVGGPFDSDEHGSASDA
jgi:hypothetical protein